MRTSARLAALTALALAACGGDGEGWGPPPPRASPARVSAASPFAASCATAQPGVRYAGSAVEPSLAVAPGDPDHLVAAWQQDRWSNGGADGLVAAVSRDGGRSWREVALPFSTCGGGGRGGAYQRATDPWVAFSADGATVHVVGLAFDASASAASAVLAARSGDGGVTWGDPVALAHEERTDLALDKPSLTADPRDPLRVYAAWDRVSGLDGDPALQAGPAWFARSDDGGASWTAPAVLHDPGLDAQTISSQLLVLPDGALLDVFVRITAMSSPTPVPDVVAARSDDGGASWGAPVEVSALLARGARDPATGHAIRAGEVVPSAAVDAQGNVHVAWQDARFAGGARDGIALATSADGGRTWSAPRQVNGAPAAEAFRPALAAGPGGVAVTYYDLRDDVPGAPGTWATFWRATSTDGGASWSETALGGPFDLALAPDAGGWFLGDYTGLAARGGGFVALFGMGGVPTGVFLSP